MKREVRCVVYACTAPEAKLSLAVSSGLSVFLATLLLFSTIALELAFLVLPTPGQILGVMLKILLPSCMFASNPVALSCSCDSALAVTLLYL